MPTLKVKIKHAGRVYDNVPLNTDAPPAVFMQSVYERTGVPPDRMKVMVKGGTLKDNTDWNKIAPKEGQVFMVIGAAGDIPKAPEKPIVFLEDLDESDLEEEALPVGFKNLGNTCYMNATLQVMRAVPELQTALTSFQPSSSTPEGNAALTDAMRSMYADLHSSENALDPSPFLSVLREVVPQFGEMARVTKDGMSGYAQQDAEECWTAITTALQAIPGTGDSGKRFVEQYMMGEWRREMKCDEAPEEEPTISFDKAAKLECNIGSATNFMHTGILDALNQQIKKTSPSLGREALYTQRSRLSRLPANLIVHMVRFAWKRDINKKAKIMRRVAFQQELDVLDLCTDELREKLLPVNKRLRELERDRAERRRVRKRMKARDAASSSSRGAGVEMPDNLFPNIFSQVSDSASEFSSSGIRIRTGTLRDISDRAKEKKAEKAAKRPESEYRARELMELEALVPTDVKADVGTNWTGIYELVGIVTHKGAAANSGHYIGFAKKSALVAVNINGEKGKVAKGELEEKDEDEDWYKFDDEKVSVFPKEKLSSLDGGGEGASAYLLLYKSKALV